MKLNTILIIAILQIGMLVNTCDARITVSEAEKVLNSNLNCFLTQVQRKIVALKESGEIPTETIHMVLGNQSADMDSIASAIILSYSKSYEGLYVPVINIPRDELPLRGDVLYVFETLKIDPASLLYQEDIPFLLKLADQGYARITLVDHNHLAPDQEVFDNFVEKVIDHHKDENISYPLMKNSEKLIGKVGSNSTLIAELILSASPEACSSQMAYFLLSAILLDTKDLNDNDVTTKKDIVIANLLKDKAGEYYDNTLFEVLMRSRNSIEHLTPSLLLKKDYKMYREGKLLYGIASIPKGVLWIPENREEWKEAFVQSLEKQQIHLLSALAYEEDERVFIVYVPTLESQKAFIAHIRGIAALNDELVLKSYFPEEGFFFFKLMSPMTRKQLQPLLSFEKLLQ